MATPPLRRMNPKTVIADLFAALGTPVPGPLQRMSKSQIVALANEVIVESGGEPLPRGSSFADTAAALTAVYEETQGGDEGGEESDRPEWVPADGIADLQIYIDLVGGSPQGRAWVCGVGEVAVNMLLGTDVNTETGWGATAYDPENLIADGYKSPTVALALIGAARTLALAGVTLVLREVRVTDDGNFGFLLISADGNDAIQYGVRYGQGSDVSSYGGDLYVQTSGIVANSGLDGAVNVLAATLTAARAEFAVNESDAETGVVGEDDRPPGNPLVAAVVYPYGAMQSLALYDPLPSTTGLSALSATGVTNTAPTNLRALDSGTSELVQPSENVTEGYYVCTLGADDPQGNPLTYSVIDDGDGAFVFAPHADGTPFVNVGPAGLIVGENNFTARATDPGGLYVEQEFTITVTA